MSTLFKRNGLAEKQVVVLSLRLRPVPLAWVGEEKIAATRAAPAHAVRSQQQRALSRAPCTLKAACTAHVSAAFLCAFAVAVVPASVPPCPGITARAMADADDGSLLLELPFLDEPEAPVRRAMCVRCAKPQKVCLCSVLPETKLRTPQVQLLILQHPEEAGTAKGTVALLQLCLADCRVVTGRKFRRADLPPDLVLAAEQGQRAAAGIRDASTARWQRTLLLWPSPDAERLEHIVSSMRMGCTRSDADSGVGDNDCTAASQDGQHFLLVLLDGTWPSCGQMLQKSEILRALRTVCIRPEGECLYAIRMEPSPEARSTLEAAAHSIAILQGGSAGSAVRDCLLTVLSRMVQLQCAHITNPKHRNVDSKHYRANRYKIAAAHPSCSAPKFISDPDSAKPTPPHACSEDGNMQVSRERLADIALASGDAGEAASIVKEFQSKRKNKTAMLTHLVTTANRIERVWDVEPISERYDLLAAYRHCLMLLGEDEQHEGDADVQELVRLGSKIKTLHFPLSHFLALVLPIERKHSKGLRDHEFLITSEDAGKPAARRSADTGSQDSCLCPLPALHTKCVVILDNLRSAFNVGSIFRTSECILGSVASLVLTGYTATPEDAATRRSAMGMDQVVPWSWVQTVDEAIHDAKAQGLAVIALETVEGSPMAHDFVFPKQCALLLGNERHGVDPRHIALCDATVQLPCRGVKNSLNVGNAFGICVYEMTRQWSLAAQAPTSSG